MKATIRGVLFSFVLVVVFGVSVGASEHWSWIESVPTVEISESARFDTYSRCPYYQVVRRIVSVDNLQTVCIHSEGMFQFATFFLNGGEQRAAVGFGPGVDLYLLEDFCRGSTRCLYEPQTDLLVRRVYSGNNRYRSVAMPNFSHQLQRTIHSDATVSYVVKTLAQGEKSLGNDISQFSIGAIGLSQNGQWAAIEIQDGSIATVEIGSGLVKQIWRTGQQYGLGHDPDMELAISNDGQYVAVMGENSGFLVIQSKPDCGVVASTVMLSAQNCSIASIQTSRFIPSFRFGSHPAFDEKGGSLQFLAASYTSSARFVVVRAWGYESTPRLQYLAMGDSFVSGEGESGDAFYLAGTNDEYERCHTSRRSYPFLLSDSLGLGNLVRNVACSGAKIRDVIGDDTNYWGQASRLKILGAGVSNKLSMQTQALLGYLPGRIHQATFYFYTHPNRATIGIGGNDAGLMDKLKTCAMPGRCEWVKNATARHKTALEIERLYDKAVGLLQMLKNESPTTTLRVVGYPLIVRPYGDCDPVTATLLDSEERLFMDQGVRLLNNVLKRAASTSKIPFVDIQDSLIGHRLCEHIIPAINGLSLGDDISPISSIPSFLLIGAESFHPNPSGHQLIAKAIERVISSESTPVSCTDCNNQLSDYWTYGAEPIDNQSQYASNFLDRTTFSDRQKDMAITLEPLSFLPGSSVTVEVHSDSATLGEFTANESGALEITARLPDDIGEGYHTIHVRGVSYTHQPIDNYQTIFYKNEPVAVPFIEVISRTTPNIILPDSLVSANILPNEQEKAVLGSSSSSLTSRGGSVRDEDSKNRSFSVVIVGLTLVGVVGSIVVIRKALFRTRDRGG